MSDTSERWFCCKACHNDTDKAKSDKSEEDFIDHLISVCWGYTILYHGENGLSSERTFIVLLVACCLDSLFHVIDGKVDPHVTIEEHFCIAVILCNKIGCCALCF